MKEHYFLRLMIINYKNKNNKTELATFYGTIKGRFMVMSPRLVCKLHTQTISKNNNRRILIFQKNRSRRNNFCKLNSSLISRVALKKIIHSINIKPLSLLSGIFQMIEEKSKIKVILVTFSLNDIFPLLFSVYSLFFIPTFYFSLYILDIDINNSTYVMLLSTTFLSCSIIYLLFIVWWNIYHKNKGNFFILIKMLLEVYINNKNKPKFYFYSIIALLALLFFILINMLCLNFILSFLGVTNESLLSYIWIRLSLLPFIFYINNIVISIITKYYTKNKTAIDYSIFSENMFTSLTLYRLLTMAIFICLGFVVRLIYFYSVIEKSSFITDIYINLNDENICGLSNACVEVVNKKTNLVDILMKTIIGKTIIDKKYTGFGSKFQPKDLTVIWLEPLSWVDHSITISNTSEVYCKDLVTGKRHFYSLFSPILSLVSSDIKLLESGSKKIELLPFLFIDDRFKLPFIASKKIGLPDFLCKVDKDNLSIIDDLAKNTDKDFKVFTSQINYHPSLFQHPLNTSAINVTVSTTRAVLGSNLPMPIYSDRLIIRSYRISDLEAYHTLLSQPEAMEGQNMSLDLASSKDRLIEELVTSDSDLCLGIFLKKSDGSEGDLIGEGGLQNLLTEGEWPELSYRFKKEYWNKGYATEFVTAFMQFWWSLPRESANLKVRPNSVGLHHTGLVEERIYANVKPENKASQKVLEKTGFNMLEYMDNGSLIKPNFEYIKEIDIKFFNFTAFLENNETKI